MADDPKFGGDNNNDIDAAEALRLQREQLTQDLMAQAEAEKSGANNDPTRSSTAGLNSDQFGVHKAPGVLDIASAAAPGNQHSDNTQGRQNESDSAGNEYSGHDAAAQKKIYDRVTSGQDSAFGGVAAKAAVAGELTQEEKDAQNFRHIAYTADISYAALTQSFVEYTQAAEQQIDHCEQVAAEIQKIENDIEQRTQEAEEQLKIEQNKLKELAEQMQEATANGGPAEISRLSEEMKNQAIKVQFASQNYETHQDLSKYVGELKEKSMERIGEIRSDMVELSAQLQNKDLSEEQRAELHTKLDDARERIHAIGVETRQAAADAQQAADFSTKTTKIGQAHIGEDGANAEAVLALSAAMSEAGRDGIITKAEIKGIEMLIRNDPSLAPIAREMGTALYNETNIGIEGNPDMDREQVAAILGERLNQLEEKLVQSEINVGAMIDGLEDPDDQALMALVDQRRTDYVTVGYKGEQAVVFKDHELEGAAYVIDKDTSEKVYINELKDPEGAWADIRAQAGQMTGDQLGEGELEMIDEAYAEFMQRDDLKTQYMAALSGEKTWETVEDRVEAQDAATAAASGTTEALTMQTPEDLAVTAEKMRLIEEELVNQTDISPDMLNTLSEKYGIETSTLENRLADRGIEINENAPDNSPSNATVATNTPQQQPVIVIAGGAPVLMARNVIEPPTATQDPNGIDPAIEYRAFADYELQESGPSGVATAGPVEKPDNVISAAEIFTQAQQPQADATAPGTAHLTGLTPDQIAAMDAQKLQEQEFAQKQLEQQQQMAAKADGPASSTGGGGQMV